MIYTTSKFLQHICSQIYQYLVKQLKVSMSFENER